MIDQTASGQSKAVVDAYYQAGVRGRLTDFAPYLHPDFSTTAPNYLPWGGVHAGAAFFRDEVLPNLPDVLDFGRFSYDVFFAADERVVALEFRPHRQRRDDQDLRALDRQGRQGHIHLGRLFRASGFARQARHRPRPQPLNLIPVALLEHASA